MDTLDTVTLRVAFGIVAVCVLALFYGVTYRTTRSPYCAWWCCALVCFIASASLFLCNGTPAQVVANPLGNTLGVAGAACTWAGARSLRDRRSSFWLMIAIPGVVMAMSFLDDPAHDVWTGGPFFLAGMSLTLGLSSHELWRLRGHDVGAQASVEHRFAITSLALTSGCVSVYYLLRDVVFVSVGPAHPLFTSSFGGQATTLLTLTMLIVVTFGMSALSNEQQTRALRAQATHDSLTGALNRAELFRLADSVFSAAPHGGNGAVMVADFDDFKALNDHHGHAAGDAALIEFAEACQQFAGADGLVGRLGGDEFVIVLPDGSDAEWVAHEVGRQLHTSTRDRLPVTVSFGIARIDPTAGIKDTITRADVALYRAKAAGRDRVIWYEQQQATDSSTQ